MSDLFAQAAALAACQAIGVGPEDPLSWVCTGALVEGCTVIAQVLIPPVVLVATVSV